MTPTDRASRSVSKRNGTAIAVKMMIPPIVGVPALAWCSCGPSSRICWPNSRRRRKAMNFGDRKMHMSSEAVPAMRTSPMWRVLAGGLLVRALGQRLGDGLEAHAARRLDQHDVTRPDQLADQRRGLPRTAHGMPRAVVAVEHPHRARADRDQHVDPRRGGVGADVAVVVVPPGAELEHVAQDRDAPAGG